MPETPEPAIAQKDKAPKPSAKSSTSSRPTTEPTATEPTAATTSAQSAPAYPVQLVGDVRTKVGAVVRDTWTWSTDVAGQVATKAVRPARSPHPPIGAAAPVPLEQSRLAREQTARRPTSRSAPGSEGGYSRRGTSAVAGQARETPRRSGEGCRPP